MTDSDFQMYLRRAIPQYAYDQVRSGNWKSDESMGRAQSEFSKTLPEGPQTEGHNLITISDAEKGMKVGMLWWAMNQRGTQKIAFLADFFVFSEFRNKGFEMEAMNLLQVECSKLGVERIELQVFAHNEEDVTLYRNNGFTIISHYFGKDVN
jgi:ribosomal protein S18 acetylase RimI-like enzyme